MTRLEAPFSANLPVSCIGAQPGDPTRGAAMRGVRLDPRIIEDEGGIEPKKIAPRARTD